MKNKINDKILKVKNWAFRTEEGAKAIIVEVVLIVVAVAVCLIFKGVITGVIDDLMQSITENVKSIF